MKLDQTLARNRQMFQRMAGAANSTPPSLPGVEVPSPLAASFGGESSALSPLAGEEWTAPAPSKVEAVHSLDFPVPAVADPFVAWEVGGTPELIPLSTVAETGDSLRNLSARLAREDRLHPQGMDGEVGR